MTDPVWRPRADAATSWRDSAGYAIVDTRGDADFDELAALAARLSNAPLALVTLVDQDCQWFEELPVTSDDALRPELALSRLVINTTGQPTMIPDLRAVEMLRPLTRRYRGRELRFLAGVPLVSSDGTPLGALTVMDHRPRRLDGDQQSTLRTLARQANKQLELVRTVRRLEVVQHELAEAKQAAEAASAAKSEFLANTSHEIRTPLHGIVSSLDLLDPAALTADHTELLRLLKTSADTLSTLLNDVLDTAKIEAGRMTLESIPVDVREVARNVVRLFEPRAMEKGLRLGLTCAAAVPDRIIADPVRLGQVITNLVSNAIKFTHTGGVDVAIERPAPDELHVCVTDTGIGMSEDQVARIFESFTQASSDTARLYGGTGLGVYICDQLARLMRGRIDVRSKPGVGSTFRLIVPLVAAASFESDTAAAAIGRLQGHVLVADDNPVNRTLTHRMLDRLGVTCDLVDTGLNAIARLDCTHSVVLMDVQMPELDGMEATRRLRDRGVKTPILALTANDSPTDRAACAAAGMDGCLAKPFKLADLAELLSQYLPASAAN